MGSMMNKLGALVVLSVTANLRLCADCERTSFWRALLRDEQTHHSVPLVEEPS